VTEALKRPAADAPPPGQTDSPPATVSKIASWLVGHTLDEVERELIVHTLENCNGDRVLAASVLGLSLPAMRRKMTAYAVRGQPIPETMVPPVAKDSAKAKARKSTGEGAGEERRASAPVPEAQNDTGLTAVVAEQPKAEIVPVHIPVAKSQPPRAGKRWLLAGAAMLLPAVPLALYLAASETRTDVASPERPRLEVSAIQQPETFTPSIPVPVWNGPVPVIVDIAADKRAEAAARAAALRTIRSVVNFDSEQDTIMEAAPVVAEPLPQLRGAIASADVSLDTIMERAPEIVAPRVPAFWAAIDIEKDTRMEQAPAVSAAPPVAAETTGAIGIETFVPPEDVPLPLARPEPDDKAAKEAAPRRAARPAAPAAAPAPAPLLPPFPFNLFAPNPAARAVPAAPASGVTPAVTSAADISTRH